MTGDGPQGWYELGGHGLPELGPDQVAITFHGELDESNVERLWAALEPEVRRLAGPRDGDGTAGGEAGGPARATTAVVDLSPVRFMGSAGLRLLVHLRGALADSGLSLVTVAPPGTPGRRLLRIAGMEAELDVRPGATDGT